MSSQQNEQMDFTTTTNGNGHGPAISTAWKIEQLIAALRDEHKAVYTLEKALSARRGKYLLRELHVVKEHLYEALLTGRRAERAAREVADELKEKEVSA